MGRKMGNPLPRFAKPAKPRQPAKPAMPVGGGKAPRPAPIKPVGDPYAGKGKI